MTSALPDVKAVFLLSLSAFVVWLACGLTMAFGRPALGLETTTNLRQEGRAPVGWLGALWTRWPNQAMIIALRRSAQQHKLRVVEFDGHVWTLAFREPADPGPSLTRAPDRSDRRGEGFARDATAFADGHAHAHTLSFERKASLFLERERLKRPSGSRF